jgi:hypothetical protein
MSTHADRHQRCGPAVCTLGSWTGWAGIDQEGEELPDLDAARDHALAVARDHIARTRAQVIRDWFVCSFEIEDEDAQRLLTVPFSDTVPDVDLGD